jgi:exopolysaccharide production protein ExoQ
MPRQLALLICIFFTLYLFWVDLKRSKGPSKALWIPLIWMFLAGSRYISEWLNIGGTVESQDAYVKYLEGSPLDAIVFLCLIIGGMLVLLQRKLNRGELFTKNAWIWLFFLYAGISILWSDFPFTSSKRWIKALGNVIMALIILTEKHPYEAAGAILRRLAILVIPLSIVLCKFYPEIGRSTFLGTYTYTGMAGSKNSLGQLCLLSGIYFLSSLLLVEHRETMFGGRPHRLLSYLFLGMIAWLLHIADSATSLTCLTVVLCLLLLSRIPAIAHRPQRILTVGVVLLTLIGFLGLTFNVRELALSVLHREPSLTTRVPMWKGLLDMKTNPIFGVGYDSFWLGDRLNFLWEKYGSFIQSHNGYLETYLNLGLIGVLLIVAIIFSGLMKLRKHLTVDYRAAVMRLSIILTVAIYNWTEATFYGVSNMWLLLFVTVIDTPTRQKSATPHK